jgi:hypothetical protein
MGGPFILINRIQLVISMNSLFLISVSDVDMGIIFNKLINDTKSAGID